MARAATNDDVEQALILIAEGRTITEAARIIGCDRAQLSSALNSEHNSARARAAKDAGADVFIARAESALLAIEDEAPRAAQARQIALEQHYRKRASFLSHRYSDKVAIGGDQDAPPIKVESTVDLSGAALDLLGKIRG
jgi:hypothetical protein